MPLADLAHLTDRQIADIYLHPRDEEGKVVMPEPVLPGESGRSLPADAFDVGILGELPDTPENQRAALFLVGGALGIPQAELERVWHEKQSKEDCPEE